MKIISSYGVELRKQVPVTAGCTDRMSLLCSEIPVENGNEYNAEEDTGRKHTDFACS